MWAKIGLPVAISVMACGRLAFDPLADGTQDGGSDAAPVGNRAFVTSTMQAPVSLGGLAGADTLCTNTAHAAGLPGRFVAWLSSSAANAEDRLSVARGWYRVDNQPLADTAADIALSRMILPLRVDEFGRDIGNTDGVAVTGTYRGTANSTCSDYTDGADVANTGDPLFAGAWFSNVNGALCSDPALLYCFQIDLVVPVAVTPVSGRLAFVSTATFTPTSGRGAADAICSTEAQANNLPGTYLALLPDATENAAARFDLTGLPWVRRDGMPLGTIVELMAGTPTAPLNINATGAFVDDYAVTGGIAPSGNTADARSCDGWTNLGGISEVGVSTATGFAAFSQTTADCARAEPIYCLEE